MKPTAKERVERLLCLSTLGNQGRWLAERELVRAWNDALDAAAERLERVQDGIWAARTLRSMRVPEPERGDLVR